MSSSQRRRSAPSASSSGNGAAASSSSSSSSSAPSSSLRRARAAALVSSAKASKKRRYVDRENKCRNPFCGAALENKAQRYCDGSKFCQLRRGLELLCAWPHAPPDDGDGGDSDDDDDDAPLARSVGSSSSSRKTTAAVAGSGGSAPATATTATAASGEKRPRSSDAPTLPPMPTASKKPRVLQRHASADSIALPSTSATQPSASGAPTTPRGTATPPATPTAAATTTAQQVKAATIDVVPLGVGNRPGGGGRYVRSGNRAEINSGAMVRPPSFSRFPTATVGAPSEMPPTHTNAPSLGTTPPVSVPAPHPQSSTPTGSSPATSSAPPSRTLSRANSLPVTTTNRSRDPRVRAAAATNGDASAGATAPVRKTMSAADYLNRSRNKETTSAPTSSGAAPPVSLASAHPPEQHRPLDRSTSSSSTLRGAPPPSATDYSGSRLHGADANSIPLRRAQSDTTQYDAAKNDRYLSYRPDVYEQKPSTNNGNNQSSRPSAEWNRPGDGDYGYDPHHAHSNYGASNAYPSSNPYDNSSNNRNSDNLFISTNNSSHHGGTVGSHYASRGDEYDRKPSYHNNDHESSNSRGPSTSSTSYRSDQHDSPAVHAPRESDLARSSRSSAPRVSRAETLFASLLRPKFSHCDPLIKLILTRMASFLPEEKVGIRAVTYTTTTKRKLQFYLDYAKRVEECCGRLAKLTVNDGVAKLTIAGRDWISIEGTSTMVLYQQILERLHNESVRWRSLINELKLIHTTEKRTRSGGAINGVSFLKLWTAMKKRNAGEASELDFQSSFTMGNNNFHWVFSVGNVEIGSGSAASKVDAFKEATSTAFTFLDALEILAPEEKHRVAQVDGVTRSSSSRPSSATASRPSSGDSASRHGKVSSSSSSARTASSPRTNGATNTSTTSSSATTSSSNRTNNDTTASSASRSNGSSTDRSSSTPASTATVSMSGSSNTEVSGGARASVVIRSPRVPAERIVDASPAAERSVSDDEDRMSISSTEERTDKQKSGKPVPIPVASTSSATRSTPAVAASGSVPPATAVPTSAPAPPACRFCDLMQKSKPDALCVKCARQAR